MGRCVIVEVWGACVQAVRCRYGFGHWNWAGVCRELCSGFQVVRCIPFPLQVGGGRVEIRVAAEQASLVKGFNTP